jgi:hypothetical protein
VPGSGMRDSQAKSVMLQITDAYRRLAERAAAQEQHNEPSEGRHQD